MGWKKMQIEEGHEHVLQNAMTKRIEATPWMQTLETITLSNLQERDRTLSYHWMTSTGLITQDMQRCFD